MNSFDTINLNNGIRLITRKNENTPRISINVFIDSGVKNQNKAGIASLAARLLLQGTKTKTSKQIADELDSEAIEMSIEAKHDYIKFRSLFLNEDLNKALDILADIILNSTFDEIEKEKLKLQGEIGVELDSPRTLAVDNLIRNMFGDHPYGQSPTTVLKTLPEITKEEVIAFYNDSLSAERMNIVVVGNIDKDIIKEKLENKLGCIKQVKNKFSVPAANQLSECKTVTYAKEDAAQAQIFQGWLGPVVTEDDALKLKILNTLLGASGLSSRLFVELRDKKGLAYVVRSSYESFKHAGLFSIYIATEPSNIQVALGGFKTEVEKLMTTLVEEKELENAKNNYLGKLAFFHETNSQQAHYLGYYDIIGLGAKYDNELKEKVKKITPQDIKDVANKYLSLNSIVSILAPEKFLK